MPTKKTMTPAMRKLSPRARGVVKKAAREIGNTYDLKPKGVARFKRAAARDIARGTGKGYKQAIVKSAKVTATKAEAKGVKKVLSRQPATTGRANALTRGKGKKVGLKKDTTMPITYTKTARAKTKVGIPKRGQPRY